MSVSVIAMSDLELISRGWQSISFGQCDRCEAVEILSINKRQAVDELARIGAMALELRLEQRWGWSSGLCPECLQGTEPLTLDGGVAPGVDGGAVQEADDVPEPNPQEQGDDEELPA